MDKQVEFWSCDFCGRCYLLDGVDLEPESEKRMSDLEKSWIKQGEMTLCCREGYDKWRIAQLV